MPTISEIIFESVLFVLVISYFEVAFFYGYFEAHNRRKFNDWLNSMNQEQIDEIYQNYINDPKKESNDAKLKTFLLSNPKTTAKILNLPYDSCQIDPFDDFLNYLGRMVLLIETNFTIDNRYRSEKIFMVLLMMTLGTLLLYTIFRYIPDSNVKFIKGIKNVSKSIIFVMVIQLYFAIVLVPKLRIPNYYLVEKAILDNILKMKDDCD